MRRSRKLTPGLTLAISLSLLMILAPSTAGAENVHGARADTIKAVVVRSDSQCSDTGGGWTDINDNWQNYGSIPVTVDFSDPSLCNTTITYEALLASGADVVILSDPCGSFTYSQQEVDALRQYARDDHNLIGTYLLFCANPALGPLFGYQRLAHIGLSFTSLRNPYRLFDPTNPLFRNLSNPFQSEGLQYTQLPPDGTWSHNELRGAVYLAKTDATHGAVISAYSTVQYSAIYISNMPEYFGGPGDSQFLYNAIIYPSTG